MKDKYCPLIDDYCVGNCMFHAGNSCTIAEATAALSGIADALDTIACGHAEDTAE